MEKFDMYSLMGISIGACVVSYFVAFIMGPILVAIKPGIHPLALLAGIYLAGWFATLAIFVKYINKK